MKIYADIDGTICLTKGNDYKNSKPIMQNIDKINKLFDEGHEIIYWTARGGTSGIDWHELTNSQLRSWGCRFDDIVLGEKPDFDMIIDDRAKNINEL